MSGVKMLLKGSILRSIDQFILLGAGFFITPLIVHSLGDRMYGVWTLIGAFIGYYSLMDFGLSSAAARYLSQSLGKGDLDELNAVANTSFFLFSLIGAAVLLLSVLCAAACGRFIAASSDRALFQALMLLMGASTALGFPLRVFTGVLTAHLRYDYLSYLSITRVVASTAGVYYCLRGGGGIMSVAVVTVAASLLQNAAAFAACRARYPEIKIAPFRRDPARIKVMLAYGWKIFLCQLGDLLRFRLDTVLIAGFLNVGLLTPYAIGVRLVDGFCHLVFNSVGMMLPVFSRYEGRGDHESIQSALLMSTRLGALLSAFVGFSVIFYAPAFILRWMGPGFESSYWVAAILCVGFIFQLPQSPGVQLLCALSKHDVYAALTVCEGVMNLALSLLFLKYYGMYGVALGSAVEMVLFKLFVQPFYICRAARLPVRAYLGDVILGTLAKAAAALGIYFYLIKGLVRPDYGRLTLCVAAQTLVFIPAAYFLMIGKAERLFINRVLRLDEAFVALGLASKRAA